MNILFQCVALGADHAGYVLKESLKEILNELGVVVIDFGITAEISVDYPDYAAQVSQAVLENQAQMGLLICGTGIGMAMAANRFKGIRAAVCNEGETAARLTRQHNNANVLCFGARLVGVEVAQDCLRAFLTTPFSGDNRHCRRVAKLG